MKLAYLLNSYPLISTTFIRREIEAIEALGQPVKRFAMRRWAGQLVDPDDIADQGRTEYILSGATLALVLALLRECVTNLPRLLALLPHWRRAWKAEGTGLIRHIAYLLEAIRFRQRAVEEGIEHTHVHFSTNAATVAMHARRLGGPPFSFTVHGPDELVNPAANAIRDKIEAAAFVVAITDFCRARLVLEAPDLAEKIIIVRCGLILPDFPFIDDVQAGGPIVCVGRLCANKAQALIPAALALVKDEYPGIMVELVGGGEHEGIIRAESKRLGVSENIRLHGWASADTVRERVRASSALLLPSFAEGLPIVLMEALALGRPVLTTYVAGIHELVDEKVGWIFPAGSIEAIAGALRGAMAADRKTLLAMASEGRRRVEERHDLARSAQALLLTFMRSKAQD
jgi:colanic acid/amylovoran biosynthesis glycosyltransferase